MDIYYKHTEFFLCLTCSNLTCFCIQSYSFIFFFNEQINSYSILGMILILLGVILTSKSLSV